MSGMRVCVFCMVTLFPGRRVTEVLASWSADRPVQGNVEPGVAIRTIVNARTKIRALQVSHFLTSNTHHPASAATCRHWLLLRVADVM